MRHNMIRSVAAAVCCSLILGGCSARVKQKKEADAVKQDTYYASDSKADDFDGYVELLKKYTEFETGKDYELEYDFDCPEYQKLIQEYDLEKIAGEGSDLERAVRLMDEFAPRLTHKGDFANADDENALVLLKGHLDQEENGINCRAKAKVLEEMCLALHIYARRISIKPYSSVDSDMHVVNEIYDRDLKKWIMIDLTTDGYFVDEQGTPLSAFEVREHAVKGEFFTFRSSDENGDLHELFEEEIDNNTYFAKNVFYFEVEQYNGFGSPAGKREKYVIIPKNFDVKARELSNSQFGEKFLKENNGPKDLIAYCVKTQKEVKERTFLIMNPQALQKAPK